jgi:hypothetical protein
MLPMFGAISPASLIDNELAEAKETFHTSVSRSQAATGAVDC